MELLRGHQQLIGTCYAFLKNVTEKWNFITSKFLRFFNLFALLEIMAGHKLLTRQKGRN